jgi:Tol biopolymer transport system component
LHLKLITSGEVRTIPQPEGLPPEAITWYPHYWFSDGTRFIAIQKDATGGLNSWFISALGGLPRLLRENANAVIPSPDGSRIAYLAGAIRTDGSASELWLMGTQGENPRKFLAAPEGDSLKWPVWSPDGQRIAYTRYHNSESSIECRNLEGKELTTLFSDPRFIVWGLWWFPDGRLFFTAKDVEPDGDSILWEVRVDQMTGRPLSHPRRITKWAGMKVWILNGTLDGKRLTVQKAFTQVDVFVGDLDAKGHRLKNPRRLTFDEQQDWPFAWSNDSKAIFFHSDRNGQFDIFRQGLDQETAVPVVTGPGNQWGATLSPDGSLILFIEERPGGGVKTRVMRAPVSGGPREMVLEATGLDGLGCSWSPANLCVLTEVSPDLKQYILTAFDPMKGRGRELTRVNLRQPIDHSLANLSRDMSYFAFAENLPGSQKRIRIVSLSGGEAREVVIQREMQMTSLAWANDGKGFYIGSSDGALLFVDMDGNADILWRRETLWDYGPGALPSRDGHHLAVAAWTIDSNVWMLENF